MLGSRLIGGLIGTLIGGLASGVMERANTLILGMGGWLVFGLIAGLIFGLIVGIIDGVRFERRGENAALKKGPTRRQQVINVLVVGLIYGLAGGLLAGLFAGLYTGLMGGLIGGATGGLFWGLRGSRQSLTNDIQTVEALSWSWEKAWKLIPLGLIGGFIFGLISTPILEMNPEMADSLQSGVFSGLLGEWDVALRVGLFTGSMFGLSGAMFGGLNSNIIETKTVPNQGIRLSVRNGFLTGPGFGLIIGLIGGLLFGLIAGFWIGVHFGLYIGLIMGAIAGGWYGGMERAIVITVAHSLYAYTVGVFLASWGRASILHALKNVAKVPAPYAAVLGLIVNFGYLDVPEWLMRVAGILRGAAIPLMLILLGIQISRVSFKGGQWRVVLGASAIRLVGGTIVGRLLSIMLGLPGVTRQAAIIQSSMPTAVIATILATEFESDARLVSGIVLASTLLSVITLSVLLYILTGISL